MHERQNGLGPSKDIYISNYKFVDGKRYNDKGRMNSTGKQYTHIVASNYEYMFVCRI